MQNTPSRTTTCFHLSTLALTVTLGALPASGIAKSNKFPPGCREVNFTFEGGQLILDYNPKVKTQAQTLYLIHNVTYGDLRLQVPNPQKYKPSYSKVIPYGSWAAIAKNKGPVTLECSSVLSEGIGYIQNCGQSLEICNYNNAKFPKENTGTYWLARTGDLTFIKYYAIRKGVLLRW